MFAGIIQCVGKVRDLRKAGGSCLTLWVESGFKSLDRGESVSVDGVCLTVTQKLKGKKGAVFCADVSLETVRKTSLSRLKKGDPLNLERSLRLNERIGGHFVQGHVDGTGEVTDIRPEGDSKMYTFSYPASLEPCLVPKGSVAVNGISLTVAALNRGTFSAAIIPFTELNTNLGSKKPGDLVNLEGDFLAKVIAKQFQLYRKDVPGAGDLYQKKTVSWEDLMKEDGLT